MSLAFATTRISTVEYCSNQKEQFEPPEKGLPRREELPTSDRLFFERVAVSQCRRYNHKVVASNDTMKQSRSIPHSLLSPHAFLR